MSSTSFDFANSDYKNAHIIQLRIYSKMGNFARSLTVIAALGTFSYTFHDKVSLDTNY